MSFDRTDIKSKAIAFCDDLNIQSNRSFKLYPFSNEYNFGFTINKLSHYEPIKTEKLRIAILVGESHFLSLLPELQKHTDVIILNDINPKMHSHFNHLLKCLNEANTIQEFENKYRDNHPIKIENQKWYMNDSFMLKVVTIDSLSKRLMNDDVFFDGGKDKIFTSSLERFQECKEAAKKIMFVHAKTDLLNENKCDELFSIIKKHDAVITLINMTNLHYYDDKNTLISLIQKMSNDTLIMYSLDEKPGANVECTMSQLESTISQVKEYVDYLNLFHKMKQLKIEIEQKKRLETFKRIISMNYLASFQLNPLEYPLNSYIGDAFYSAIRFYPDLFIKLSEDIDKGLKKDINSKEYEYAKSALDTLTQMYDSYIPSAILKLNTPTQITFTQLIELSKQIASAPHCGPKNR